MRRRPTLLYLVNQGATFFSHRLPWARRARDAGWEIHVAGPLEIAPERFLADHFTPHSLPLVRGFGGPRAQLRALASLTQTVRDLQPDVVHVVGTQFVATYGPLLRLTGARAIVASVTGLGHAFLTPGARGAAMKGITLVGYGLCRAQGARFVFQNRDDLETVRGYGLQLNAQLIRGSGVDTSMFALQESRDVDTPTVMLPARLIREKGIHQFIDATRRLRERGTQFHAVLVGGLDDANPSGISRDEVLRWEEEGLIEWNGHSTNMVRSFSEADIVVLPSYREGLPKALLEAASMGKPLVATDVPGCREIVVDGENGFLVPLHDHQALAVAIERLVESFPLRTRFGRRGREMVERHFSAEVVSRQYLELYESVQKTRSGT